MFILFETASGYALFERVAGDEVGMELDEVQEAVKDLARFGRYLKLKSFAPFKSAAHALENINDVSEGIVNAHLKSFLELNLPGKKSKVQLGVFEKGLAGAIKADLGYDCQSNEVVAEVVRGIRLHADKLLGGLKEGDLEKAQLGLGHSYSRAKVKFNVNRADNMIIQAIALLDQLDKDINTFSMRVREWYSWHFPELIKIVADNHLYAKLAKHIRDKSRLTEADIPALEDVLATSATPIDGPGKARQILEAAKSSMGTDIADTDMDNIEQFANRVVELGDYRKSLHAYLVSKMHQVAPNLSALIGETVGARLISHAGSLTNLSKYPASTVQILGAEKALFRALKTKGNTPKYGLIYHSTFIGRAGQKNKGRISRFLANKCSIASRIDCFIEKPTQKFGEILRDQVEERLKFYEEGTTPRRNADAMKSALDAVKAGGDDDEMEVDLSVPGSKRKADTNEEEKGTKKKSKKDKSAKSEKEKESAAPKEEPERAHDGEDTGEKKKKKKKKNKKDGGDE